MTGTPAEIISGEELDDLLAKAKYMRATVESQQEQVRILANALRDIRKQRHAQCDAPRGDGALCIACEARIALKKAGLDV